MSSQFCDSTGGDEEELLPTETSNMDFASVIQEAADLLTEVQLESERRGISLDEDQRLRACGHLSTCLAMLNSWQQYQDSHAHPALKDDSLQRRVKAICELIDMPFETLTDEHIIDAVDAACDALRKMCQVEAVHDETKSLARDSLRQVMKGVKLAREARGDAG